MPDRRFTWEAIIDNKSAIRSINELTDALKRAFQQSGTKVELIDRASIDAAKAAVRSAATEAVEAQKRETIEVKTQSAERVQIAKNESALVAAAAKAASATKIEEERRTTALLRAELQERQRAISESTKASSSAGAAGGNGLQNAVLGGIAGYFTVQGAKQIFNYAKEIATLDTTVSRASKAFEVMSGSAGEAEKRLRAIVSASGGTVDNLQAMQIANQATSLGLAKTSAEFENLTRAARAVTFVSPVIHDVQSAITELALASSNLSYRRLDQLGLSVTEVKDRMKELQAANSNLDDSQAFLQASTDALNAKFGPLLDSVEAQAGGVEKLTTAWANFTQGLADGKVGEAVNRVLSEIAKGIDQVNAAITGDNSGLGTRGNLTDLIQFRKEGQKKYEKTDGPSPEYEKIVSDLEKLLAVYDQIDKLAAAGVPGAELLKQQITELVAETVASEQVTKSAAAELTGFNVALSTVANGLDNSTAAGRAYAKLIELIGEDQAKSNADAKALTDALVSVEIQYRAGLLTLPQYEAAVSSLTQAMYGMTLQADDAANAVARLNNETRGGINGSRGVAPTYYPSRFSGLGAQNAGAQFAADLASGGHNGLYDTGGSLQDRNKGQAAIDQKEREKADREAASAAKKSATAGAKLYNQTAEELKSTISAIVKLSEVTQQDIEDAKNGIYKEKPDEYVRRLRDEVKNGKDYKDVSIEDAAAGLNKIGIETVGKTEEAILQLFESAFSDLSLFSNKENLSFLNDSAVQEQLKLKELAKLGQQNVFEHYGVVVGQAVQAALGGSGGGTAAGTVEPTAAAINVDGKGITGGGLEIAATVTGVQFAEGVEQDFADKFKTVITINRESISIDAVGIAQANLDLRAKLTPSLVFTRQSVVFSGDETADVKSILATLLTPTLTFGKDSVTLSDEDATTIKDSLSSKLSPTIDISAPGVITAEKEAMDTIRDGIGKALTPKITPTFADPTQEEIQRIQGVLDAAINTPVAKPLALSDIALGGGEKKANPYAQQILDSVKGITPVISPVLHVEFVEIELLTKHLEQTIIPTVTPKLGEPTAEDVASIQSKVSSLLNSEQTGPKPLALSEIGMSKKKKTNPMVKEYIDGILAGFNDPDATLPLLGVGAFVMGVIDSGFQLAKTENTIGTDIIIAINEQVFSESNVAAQKSIGFNIYQLIIAGIRTAMKAKNNNVGQEIVDTIAAQVVEATVGAVEGAP